MLARISEPCLIQNLVLTKRQEIAIMEKIKGAERWKTCLERI